MDNPNCTFYSGERPRWQIQSLNTLYLGCIGQIDTAVGRLVRTLDRRGSLNDTLVMITSDHGECFGGFSRVHETFPPYTHNIGLHEHLVHVPLMIRRPEGRETIDSPVSLVEFPEVVRDAIDSEGTGTPFESDDPVVAAGQYQDE